MGGRDPQRSKQQRGYRERPPHMYQSNIFTWAEAQLPEDRAARPIRGVLSGPRLCTNMEVSVESPAPDEQLTCTARVTVTTHSYRFILHIRRTGLFLTQDAAQVLVQTRHLRSRLLKVSSLTSDPDPASPLLLTLLTLF